MASHRQYIVRINWHAGSHLVQVGATTHSEAHRIIKAYYPGCTVDSTRQLR